MRTMFCEHSTLLLEPEPLLFEPEHKHRYSRAMIDVTKISWMRDNTSAIIVCSLRMHYFHYYFLGST